jgi:4,5-DOPA dioxygenase extradiol
MLPSLFLSHGSPMLALEDSPAASFLRGLPSRLPARPRAILVASAHWEAAGPRIGGAARNETIHDFGGFPPALYQIRYDAPGAPDIAGRAAQLLAQAGFDARIDAHRGLDHGAWVPLSLAWPEADIPVFQLSIQTHEGPAHHLALGRALQPLRDEVLIVGSGSWTHDLGGFRGQGIDAPEPDYVRRFADWADAALMKARTADLLAYRTLAPDARRNHPTEEHFLPLFVAYGAGAERNVAALHRSTEYGVLHMDAYAFG